MEKKVYTVTELNLAAQKLLEGHFTTLTVEGEISNLSKPISGHLYFSLKDARAQIRCAFFRYQSRQLDFELKNGLLVQVTAKVSLYPDRGDYQLIVSQISLGGEGLLKQALEKLTQKLKAEGLFDEKWKKPLPLFPKKVGIITSATGAALRDILNVLKRRFPALPLLIFPSKVQGVEAAAELVRAIQFANTTDCEVLILARGGGSLEDLWPFNEEIVARAIFASTLPIVTGVGHEIDFTIADFVADKRAPTPSAAAELVSPLQAKILQEFLFLENRLKNEIIKFLNYRAQTLDHFLKRLRHPRAEIAMQLQRLKNLKLRLFSFIENNLQQKQNLLTSSLRALDMVSPLATLGRGYAIVSESKTGQIMRSVQEISREAKLKIRLQDGEISCQAE